MLITDQSGEISIDAREGIPRTPRRPSPTRRGKVDILCDRAESHDLISCSVTEGGLVPARAG
jgi:hypothetical protein